MCVCSPQSYMHWGTWLWNKSKNCEAFCPHTPHYITFKKSWRHTYKRDLLNYDWNTATRFEGYQMIVQTVLTVLLNTSRKCLHVILHKVLCKMATASCIDHYVVCILVAYHVNVCKISNTFIMPILFKAESWFQSSTKAMENSTAMSQQCTTSVYCQYDTYHCFSDNTYPQQTQHCTTTVSVPT